MSTNLCNNHRLLVINVGGNLFPASGLRSLGGRAGEWWWHTPGSREAASHCQRRVTEGNERGRFDCLYCDPSMSLCANMQLPYSSKSGLGENSIMKHFGQKAHGYFELVGEHKVTTSNFAKTPISRATFWRAKVLETWTSICRNMKLYSLKLIHEGLSLVLQSGASIFGVK